MFFKRGYFNTSWTAPLPSTDTEMSVTIMMQPELRVAAGSTIFGILSSDDPTYSDEGDFYSNPTVTATGEPGQAELVVHIPAARAINTVLIGLNPRSGPAELPDPVAFTFAIETT
jgi:hypothetical protein